METSHRSETKTLCVFSFLSVLSKKLCTVLIEKVTCGSSFFITRISPLFCLLSLDWHLQPRGSSLLLVHHLFFQTLQKPNGGNYIWPIKMLLGYLFQYSILWCVYKFRPVWEKTGLGNTRFRLTRPHRHPHPILKRNRTLTWNCLKSLSKKTHLLLQLPTIQQTFSSVPWRRTIRGKSGCRGTTSEWPPLREHQLQ